MEEKKFVIVIPSFKNKKWCEKNLLSAVSQRYSNFRIIYTDDCSPDGTADAVEDFIKKYKTDKITLIRNAQRLGALQNLYNMIHSCEDNEIIATLDGDDWLAHSDVLNILNKIYTESDIWMSWGSYMDYPSNTRGCCKAYDLKTIQTNTFHLQSWRMSHLRAFYAGLFKKIKAEDLMYNGRMAEMGWDVIFMMKLIQMARYHHKYINDILYIYNNENPISDHRVNQQLQAATDRYARMQKSYDALNNLFIGSK